MNAKGTITFAAVATILTTLAWAPSGFGQVSTTSAVAIPVGRCDPRKPISSLPFTIDECGSYYLTRCLTGVSGQNGITVTADDVTIDLNGFALIGVPGSLDGILVNGPEGDLRVLNGTIRDWGDDGVDVTSGGGPYDTDVLENLFLFTNGDDGLSVGGTSYISNCAAQDNGGRGIAGSGYTTVVNCRANGNTGIGFYFGNGTTLNDCTSTQNGGHGFELDGRSSVIRGSSAENNSGVGILLLNGAATAGNVVEGCTVSANMDDGIRADGYGNSVAGCTATGNGGVGIEALARCRITNNSASGNLEGVLVTGSGNHVQGNSVVNNTNFGIRAGGTNSLIVGNSAGSNGTDYSLTGNSAGEIVDATGGATITSGNPWANLRF